MTDDLNDVLDSFPGKPADPSEDGGDSGLPVNLPTGDADEPEAATEEPEAGEGGETSAESAETPQSTTPSAEDAQAAPDASVADTASGPDAAPNAEPGADTALDIGNTQDAPRQPPPRVRDADLPHPTGSAPSSGPELGDLVGEGAVTSRKPTTKAAIAKLWDVMMTEVSPQTRDAIWEQGFTDMATLLATPKQDFTHPRGSLRPNQIAELAAWLLEHELVLRESPAPRRFSQRPAGVPTDARAEDVGDRSRREVRILGHRQMRRG